MLERVELIDGLDQLRRGAEGMSCEEGVREMIVETLVVGESVISGNQFRQLSSYDAETCTDSM